MYLHEVLEILKKATGHQSKKSGSGYITKCPAHNDLNPSLSVTEGTDGRVLLHYHSRREIEVICDSLKISITDLFSTKTYPNSHSPPKYTEYTYVDDQDNPLYKKIRIEPGKDGKTKDFYISSVNSNGEWKNGLLRTSKRFLYRINDVLKAIREGKEIYLVDGEKDADRLFREGLVATTMIEGAGAKIRPEYVAQIQNANIILMKHTTGLLRFLLKINLYVPLLRSLILVKIGRILLLKKRENAAISLKKNRCPSVLLL